MVSVICKLIPATSSSENTSTYTVSTLSGFRFISISNSFIFAASSVTSIIRKSPKFQLIFADSDKITPSANSNETVIPESSSFCKYPPFGPLPNVLGLVSSIPSPSMSCRNPVRIISPVKIPLAGSVSYNLYSLNR